MTIEQLVKVLEGSQYQGNGAEKKKIEMIRKHLKVEYVSYLAKMDICSKILKSSRYKELNDKVVYSPNGPLEYELKIISIIQTYYDFELREGLDRIADFDMLEENNISGLLLKGIGDEFERLNAIYNMMAEDINYKESLVPFIDTKIESISIVMDQWIKLLGDPMIKDKVAQSLIRESNEKK